MVGQVRAKDLEGSIPCCAVHRQFDQLGSAKGLTIMPVARSLSRPCCECMGSQPSQLAVDVLAFVEGNPTSNPLCLPGWTIGNLRVGMEARARRIAPRVNTWLPPCDDPAPAGRIPAGRKRLAEDLVVIRPAVETDQSLEHHAHLYL